ncbi:bifunctional adenosylcobinamide kinase/adenosylcobinamide-phosphate guanylyltransferase [Nocardioides caeni]
MLLAATDAVTYVAAGPTYDDADWAARVSAHRERRPAAWSTEETRDVAGVLGRAGTAGGPVLVDCLGTWLTGVIDEAGLWEAPVEVVEAHVLALLDELVTAVARAAGTVVLVTNEVGLGVVPEHRSARLFRDLLGTINQRLGAVCDEVHLVVAGRVLRL